jgi:hypothetical protein
LPLFMEKYLPFTVTKYSILPNMRVIGEQMIQRYKPKHLDIDISILYLTKEGYEEIYFE